MKRPMPDQGYRDVGPRTTVGTRLGLALLLLILPLAARGQNLTAEPGMLDQALRLFPEAKTAPGPFRLEFKADVRMHASGFEVRNFALLSGERSLGMVSHVKSILPEGLGSQVEYLVCYDARGQVVDLVPLREWRVGEQVVDIEPLLSFLRGKDPQQVQQAVLILMSSVAAAAGTQTMKPPAGPPKGYTVNLEQKILTPGAKLPPLKSKDLNGNDFDSTALGDKPLVLVFCSPRSQRCPEMAAATEELLTWPRLKDRVHLVYIVIGTDAEVHTFATQNKLSGTVLADPTNQLSMLLKVPFKPYALFFDAQGELKMNVYWTEKPKLAGCLFQLLGLTPTEADVPKPPTAP